MVAEFGYFSQLFPKTRPQKIKKTYLPVLFRHEHEAFITLKLSIQKEKQLLTNGYQPMV